MGKSAMADPAKYAEEFDYLLEYARTDFVGFHVVTGAAVSILGMEAGDAECRSMILRLVADLFTQGVHPGNFDPRDGSFAAWDASPDAALRRIVAEMTAMDHLPEAAEICWFST